jgi:3-oxoadipate enol-lactonase
LLFIHGWALDLEVWAPQARTLSEHYRVVRYDRRGFGLSSGTPSLARDVSDAVSLIDRLELGRVVLIGASQGARAALGAALATPERVAALVLDSPPALLAPGLAPETPEIPMASYRELARRGELDGVRRAWAQHPLTRLVTSDPAARRRLARICARYPGRDLLAPDPSDTSDTDHDPRALRVPLLVINGERDLATRIDAGRALAGAIGARHVLVPDAGHLPNIDNPARYDRAIHEFSSKRTDPSARHSE